MWVRVRSGSAFHTACGELLFNTQISPGAHQVGELARDHPGACSCDSTGKCSRNVLAK